MFKFIGKLAFLTTASVCAVIAINEWAQPDYTVADPSDNRTLEAEHLPKKDGQVLCYDTRNGDMKWIDVVMVSDQLKERIYWFTKNGTVYLSAGDGWKKNYAINDRL